MKWYGRYVYSPDNKTSRANRRNFLKSKNLSQVISTKMPFHFYKAFIYFPSQWKITFLSFKNPSTPYLLWYAASHSHFFILPLPKRLIIPFFDTQINVLEIRSFYKNDFYGLFWNAIKIAFSQLSKLFFVKLKFKGKGYYIYKNYRSTIATQFGYSHIRVLYSYFINVKFLSKTCVFVFGVNKRNINFLTKSFFQIRPINIFTGKGIRFSKQIIYKKTGKISSYR